MKTITTLGIAGILMAGLSSPLLAQCPFNGNLNATNVTCNGGTNGKLEITGLTGAAPYTYSWDGLPAISSCVALNLPAGEYSVFVTDANNCTIMLSQSIAEPTALTLAMQAPESVCSGDTVKVSSVISGGVQPYDLTGSCGAVDCGFISISNNNSTITPVAGNVYNFQATDANGCISEVATFSVDIKPVPQVDAGADITIYGGDAATLFGSSDAQGTYSWSPVTALASPDAAITEANPSGSITYTLHFTSDDGCEAEDQVSVEVLTDFLIAEALTPDGDALNDVWKIKGLTAFDQSLVEVYTKTGQLVFSSPGYAHPWDGKYDGELLPPGPYEYLIWYGNDNENKLSGVIYLIY